MKYILNSIFLLFLIKSGFGQIDTISINEIIQNEIKNHHFEGTILIADQGKVVYQNSYGFADRDNQSLINDKSIFSIASITKMFTAIIILQLVEEGKLSLSSNLKELLPEIEIKNSKKITVHHLLLHISGLPNENDLIYLTEKSPTEFVTKTLNNKGKSAKFGRFNYANIDYVLLGLIIEKITQNSWQDEVRARFIEPLGLQNTGFLRKGFYPENFANSYSISKNGKFKKDPSFYIENFSAAGSMYSTAQDLLLVDQAMYGEDLISKTSQEKMFTSYPEYNYSGYSVWTYRYPFADSKPRLMERRGGIRGTNCLLLRMLDKNRSLIILSNNDAFNPDSFGDKTSLKEALIIELAK